MAIPIANSSDSWITTLTDPGVEADVSSLAADGALSYRDFIKILTDIASCGRRP